MNRLAVAAVVAAVVALEAMFAHVVVAAPLASFMHDAAEPLRPTFEESILVQAVAKGPPPVVHAGG